MDTTRTTTPRGHPALHISGVSAESSGRMFAGLADNSIRATFHADTHVHYHSGKFLGRREVSMLIAESLAQPETTTGPLSTVPFVRDKDFVSRDTLLEQIHEKCSVEGSRIALVGLGGVGLVPRMASGRFIANKSKGNRNSPFNILTRSEASRRRRGCSGSMRVTRPGSSKASEALRTR
jgi:hypothetical protein